MPPRTTSLNSSPLEPKVLEEGPRREVRLGGKRIDSRSRRSPARGTPGLRTPGCPRACAPLWSGGYRMFTLPLPWRHGTPPGRAEASTGGKVWKGSRDCSHGCRGKNRSAAFQRKALGTGGILEGIYMPAPRCRRAPALVCPAWPGPTSARSSREQVALAAAPLVAVLLLGATASETGILQTAQTLPFLLLSIPAGGARRQDLPPPLDGLRGSAARAVPAVHPGAGRDGAPLDLRLLAAMGFPGGGRHGVLQRVSTGAGPGDRAARCPGFREPLGSSWREAWPSPPGPPWGGAVVGWTGGANRLRFRHRPVPGRGSPCSRACRSRRGRPRAGGASSRSSEIRRTVPYRFQSLQAARSSTDVECSRRSIQSANGLPGRTLSAFPPSGGGHGISTSSPAGPTRPAP